MGQAPLKKRLVAPDRDTKNRWVDACCALLGKSLAEPEPPYAYHDDSYYPHDYPYADPYEVSRAACRRLFSLGCVVLRHAGAVLQPEPWSAPAPAPAPEERAAGEHLPLADDFP